MTNDPCSEGTLERLTSLLDRMAAPGGRPITRSTELYSDLGLAGDDLYDVIVEVRRHFGTDFTAMKLGDYAPGETEALFSLDTLRTAIGRPRRYRSLTVQCLETAVSEGIWKGG